MRFCGARRIWRLRKKLLVLNVKRGIWFRRGRQGKFFTAVIISPKCNSLPAKPYIVPCPTCHFPLSLKVKMGKTNFPVQQNLPSYFWAIKVKRVKWIENKSPRHFDKIKWSLIPLKLCLVWAVIRKVSAVKKLLDLKQRPVEKGWF